MAWTCKKCGHINEIDSKRSLFDEDNNLCLFGTTIEVKECEHCGANRYRGK